VSQCFSSFKFDKEKSSKRDEEIEAFKKRIGQLESELERKSQENIARESSFPFKKKNEIFQYQNQRPKQNLKQHYHQIQKQHPFKRYRSEREIQANKTKKMAPGNGFYCERCRRTNHSSEDCWWNRYCSGCNKKGHSDQECAFRNRGRKGVNSIIDEISDDFSPLILFNVSSLSGKPIPEVIADSGAGISAIIRELAVEL
jgi:hypothetical protein